MIMESQDIRVGPIEVDSGNHWTDFWTVLILIAVASAAYVIVKRLTR